MWGLSECVVEAGTGFLSSWAPHITTTPLPQRHHVGSFVLQAWLICRPELAQKILQSCLITQATAQHHALYSVSMIAELQHVFGSHTQLETSWACAIRLCDVDLCHAVLELPENGEAGCYIKK